MSYPQPSSTSYSRRSQPKTLQELAREKLAQRKAKSSESDAAGLSPTDYIRSKLGLTLWSRQTELVESTWQNTITGCISGQKTGKTLAAAGIAIAWCKLHPRGIVRLAAASEDQLIDGLWGEIRTLLIRHPELAPLPNLAPSTGWHPSDNQKIIGVSAKEANRIAGRSGPEQLWIVDEACGID
jgi:phage terminase large subunit